MKRAALFLLILFASCEKIIYKGVDNCHVTSLTGKNNQFNFIYVNNLLVQFEEDSATFYRINLNNLLNRSIR